ncbi:hypothetical protein [Paremcibacter congregatus]|uniref:hypothetical protein n=1 Tax=Paremcibacter congregatus TaxID=2043170 RepID=UPI0030EC437E|tara:strand:+ start:4749 stop:4937 length:189 start_codon:yes stop_codon:yes gene_type:complete
MQYPIEDLIRCVQREISLRQSLFPSLVNEGSMTTDEAEIETSMMVQVAEHLIRHSNQKENSL